MSHEGILADHLPPTQNRGRNVAKIEVSAHSLLNHPVGKGLGKPEIAEFAPSHFHRFAYPLTRLPRIPNIAP
jgi:hypothetical protein